METNVNKSEAKKLFDAMVERSNGEKKRLPKRMDPSRNKQRKGKFKDIEFVEADSGAEELRDKKCWVCVSHSRNSNGYILYYIKDEQGKTKGSGLHRVVFELAMGKALPKELFACHRCDVPFCINPNHIFPGTAKDNASDMVFKGRNPHGEKHHSAKLTKKAAWDIRLRHRIYKETLKSLAAEYGVSVATVSAASDFKTWKA